MTRTKLCDRQLPRYSRGEEQMNTVTHGAGALMALVILVLCLCRAAVKGDPWGIATSALYGISLLAVFTVSSVYHGIPTGMAKKVMQVIDHCTIYFLIAGTYTPIVLTAMRPVYPALGWGLFFFEWCLALLAAVLTAIDLKKYSIFSMICYIGMGWAVIPFWQQVLEVLTLPGFLLVLGGGIAYTVGSILYGLGKHRKWMHSIFHIFVVLGAMLQAAAVYIYTL